MFASRTLDDCKQLHLQVFLELGRDRSLCFDDGLVGRRAPAADGSPQAFEEPFEVRHSFAQGGNLLSLSFQGGVQLRDVRAKHHEQTDAEHRQGDSDSDGAPGFTHSFLRRVQVELVDPIHIR